jgi:anaerobic selenocysteine-containing dehydrogenase
MPKLTRRGFLKLAGASAAAAALHELGLKDDLFQVLVGNEHAPEATTQHWTPTVCRMCPAGCGILVRVVNGLAVKIEGNPRHPLSQGKVCPKAQAALQVLYDPDRLRGPKLRTGERGEGKWQDISWEEAIAQVADRLKKIQVQPHTLLFLHNAPPGQMRDLIDRFCRGYGSPNVVAVDGLDAERLAHLLTQGWFDLAAHDWENTAYVLFFGGSFLEDWQPQVHMLRAYSYMRRGRPDRRARIVQIGPRFSVSAAKADEWVPLLPGRLGALALGLAHVIVRERLYDPAFVANHCEGFDDFAALLKEQYAPETVAGLTGVPAETIKRLAREFAGHRPAVAVAGRGLGEGTNAVFDHVAVHALNALMGSIDVPGGVLRPRRLPFTDWSPALSEEPSQPRLDGAGSAAYPLAVNAPHTLPARIVADDPYIPQVLFLHEVNPLFEGAGAARWWGALARIPLIVSFSPFMDESTRYADLVLPNHTFLERWVDGTPPGGMGRSILGLGRPAVAPLHDTRHTGDVLLSLARAVGGNLADLLPWSGYQALLRFRMQGLFEAGGSIRVDTFDEFWTQLEERGVWVGDRYNFGQWDEVLTTSSGRFQFRLDQLSEALSQPGVSASALGLKAQGDTLALPHHEPPQYAGDEAEYPLHLVPYRVIADAGCRAPNAPLLWELYGLHLKEMWHNWVEINPETAHKLGIADGDQVWVESPQGRIQLKARVYEGAMPDVVNIPLGGGHTAGGRWAELVGGGNVAELVVPQTDPLAGTAAWCGTRVKVYK